MKLKIKPLSPELLSEYLHFFDNMTFCENPDWAKCYCYSFHFTGKKEEWNKESNRNAVGKLICASKMTGYLVFDGDKPIGWCNVNDKVNFQRLTEIYELAKTPDKKVASIVCFLIGPEYRRQGIASKMLERIILDYKDKEYDLIEAYPEKESLSSEHNYKGPISMYKRFDFDVIGEKENYFIVQKKL